MPAVVSDAAMRQESGGWGRGRPPLYPWATWLNEIEDLGPGQSLRFEKGKGFQCEVPSFALQLYKRGVGRVTVRQDKERGTVYVKKRRVIARLN